MLPSAPVPSTHLHFFTVKKTTSNYSQLNCSKFIFCNPYKMLLVWISLDFREPRVISMAFSNVYIPWPFPTQQEKKITWLGLRNEGPSGVIPEEFQEGAICVKSNAFVQKVRREEIFLSLQWRGAEIARCSQYHCRDSWESWKFKAGTSWAVQNFRADIFHPFSLQAERNSVSC